jgi:ATP adenylyltransferase/5',5'''-P-1,P-4-tetraphosphate phosphorylase II
VQHNPARINSTAADVSTGAIENRKCFLCIDNLPAEQTGLKYDKNFIILCNPYPIFEEHFTIINKRHSEQTLIGHFDDLLNLSISLGKYYNVFYNGPKCGASAPDHMHFQAGPKNITPLAQSLNQIKNSDRHFLLKSSKIEIRFVENMIRNFILMESANKGELLYAFKIFIKALRKISTSGEEPMMNLTASFDGENWNVIIFPRSKHRPNQYFEEGEKKLLVSPAVIDLEGLLILPREEDFKKINADDIIDIYKQVGITKEYFEYIKKKLSEVF